MAEGNCVGWILPLWMAVWVGRDLGWLLVPCVVLRIKILFCFPLQVRTFLTVDRSVWLPRPWPLCCRLSSVHSSSHFIESGDVIHTVDGPRIATQTPPLDIEMNYFVSCCFHVCCCWSCYPHGLVAGYTLWQTHRPWTVRWNNLLCFVVVVVVLLLLRKKYPTACLCLLFLFFLLL